MRRSLGRFSGPETSIHARSLADFITIMCGFRFSVHTGAFPYLGWLLISGTAVNVPAGCLAPHQLTRSSADHHRNARRMSASLLLFQGGEVPARHASIGFDYSFDKRVFRQVFVVLSYDCLGLL